MNAYICDASLYCANCIRQQQPQVRYENLRHIQGDKSGPYPDGGGEADTPQHCGECGVFLENALTTDGVEYVRERVADNIANGRTESIAVTVWARFYGISASEV
jgi:hypothetical protein